VNHLQSRYKACFSPYQNLCIDKLLLLYKGRLKFKQYIPSKRKQFGIKLYVLCNCCTGFVIDFTIYLGKGSGKKSTIGATGDIVMKLMDDYLNKGHTLYVDNWYTSSTLFELLRQKRTGACGTVKCNCKHYPTFPKEMKQGEVFTKHTKYQLATCWRDKRVVNMLSTVHNCAMVPQPDGKPSKPLAVLDYNSHMGLVDKSNMQMSFGNSTRHSMKWYKKLFFRLLDINI